MKKHQVKKVKGVKVVTDVQKDSGRPLFPAPAVFDSKNKYNRQRDKEQLRKEIEEE